MEGQSPGGPDSSPSSSELNKVAEETSSEKKHDVEGERLFLRETGIVELGSPGGNKNYAEVQPSCHSSSMLRTKFNEYVVSPPDQNFDSKLGRCSCKVAEDWSSTGATLCNEVSLSCANSQRKYSEDNYSSAHSGSTFRDSVPNQRFSSKIPITEDFSDYLRPTAFEIGVPYTPSYLLETSSMSEDLVDTSLPYYSSETSLIVSPYSSLIHGHGPGLPGSPPCPDACPVCLTPGCVAEDSGERSSFVYHVGPKRERSFRFKRSLLLDEEPSLVPAPSSEDKPSSCTLDATEDIEWIDEGPEEEEDDDLGPDITLTSTTSENALFLITSSSERGLSSGQELCSTDSAPGKILIRQNSVGDAPKTLQRQNSLHEPDSLRSGHSNERSLSWDHYVDNYRPTDDVLQELIELRQELTKNDEDLETLSDLSLIRKSPNLSKTSSKNTRCSSDVSGFSFESVWNSKQSVEQFETFQSHIHGRPPALVSGETSSGIRSISQESGEESSSRRWLPTADSNEASSSGRWLPTVDSSEDPYEYDEEIAMEVSAPPSLHDDLMLEVLCSERVSQMTRTYNDIEAVTRLLEEKEKDLELTARIGKELLSQNNKLEVRCTALEAELKLANDKIEQLSHELVKKTQFVQFLTNDLDDTGSEAGTPTALRCINAELMQRRVKVLEDENKGLRKEFAQLARDTDACEEQEQRLVEDIALQLANANVEREGMTGDLERQKEENRTLYEQVVSLTAKLDATECNLRKVTSEYDESTILLNITRDNQNSLAQELVEFKDRYAEVTQLLQDTQEDLRRQRKKGTPAVRGGLFSSLGSSAPFGMPPADSLASELESSLYSELSLDSGISSDRVPSYKKAFETVKSVTGNQRSNMVSSMALPPTVLSSSGPRMSLRAGAACTSVYSSTYSRGGDSDTESGTAEDIVFPGEPISGVPGVEGSSELADALRRLTPGEVTARRAALGGPPCPYGEYDAQFLPLGCRTPDSIMSTGSSSGYGGRNPWRLPDKLQIVKPLEGSATLHLWSQLATPTMGGLLEERPGVQTKGGRGLEDIGLHLYTLSDLEEDEEDVAYPGKSFQDSSSVYTYTDSRVMHPDDGTSVTHSLSCSLVGSRLCTGTTNSRQSTAPPTPLPLSRRNSCSTFSTSAGLAKMLNERGIDAATASALATPASEKSFTPTATPANSPDGSPLPSRSPSPTPFNPLKLPGFLSSGAELLRRTFISEPPPRSPRRTRRSKLALTRTERKALTGIRIVEKLESIGLETMIATTTGLTQPTLQGALYSRRGLPSPMTQLIGFKTALGAAGAETLPTQGSTAPLRSQRRASQSGKVRPDLGTVLGTVPGPPPKDAPSGPLGTISSMLFGRKGGLL